MINIRCETLPDYTVIAEVNTLAFGQENEAKLVEQIRRSDRYIPEISLVVEVENVVVGQTKIMVERILLLWKPLLSVFNSAC